MSSSHFKLLLHTHGGHLGSQRRNLFVGNYSDLPAVNYTNISAISCCSCGPEYPLYEQPFLTKEPCSAKSWLTDDVEPGELLNYTINAGADEVPVTFAMMALLDYEQIPINVNGSELVIFGEFEPGEKVAIPACLIVPEEKGVHELQVLWFPVPYKAVPGFKYSQKCDILVVITTGSKAWNSLMNLKHSLLKQPRRSRVAIGASSWRGSSRRLEKVDSDTLKRN